eukprot:GHRR01001431.1.p1 GENE.GHRR01001431.1~~GHRR01001431.1.p1  ORF type:complete len:186 (+),score=56.03 GHRR01001431.1:96-653(+)
MLLQKSTVRAGCSKQALPSARARILTSPFAGGQLRSVRMNANPFESAINILTVALKNSPINEGKKALAKAQAGDYDNAAVRAKVEQYINDNKVMVFSWSGCPFCKNAKALLADIGADFKALEIDTMGQEGKAIRAELAEMTDRTSMPNIWIAGKSVGGCNDGPGVATLHKQGELVPMLKAAGAVA